MAQPPKYIVYNHMIINNIFRPLQGQREIEQWTYMHMYMHDGMARTEEVLLDVRA